MSKGMGSPVSGNVGGTMIYTNNSLKKLCFRSGFIKAKICSPLIF
jgi:hypothetical protein